MQRCLLSASINFGIVGRITSLKLNMLGYATKPVNTAQRRALPFPRSRRHNSPCEKWNSVQRITCRVIFPARSHRFPYRGLSRRKCILLSMMCRGSSSQVTQLSVMETKTKSWLRGRIISIACLSLSLFFFSQHLEIFLSHRTKKGTCIAHTCL